MAQLEQRSRKTSPPPRTESYVDGIERQADQLEDTAARILARVSELRETATKLRGQ
jgi:hypothetical protein